MSEQPTMLTITQIIDEGGKKFKYGLLWWFMYPVINNSDYYYQHMLKLSEQEINKKLTTALYRCRYSSERLDCQYTHTRYIFDLLKFAQSSRKKAVVTDMLNSIIKRCMNVSV